MEVIGDNNNGDGVRGTSNDGGAGVRGIANGSNHFGVIGQSQKSGNGVVGIAAQGDGVQGTSNDGGAGVRGIANGSNHFGVIGQSQKSGNGVVGIAAQGDGVQGTSNDGGAGVRGISNSKNHVGIVGENAAGGFAGLFVGDVEVTGDIVLRNADCAEDFNIGSDLTVEPGTVMVLGEEGALYPSQMAYDKRVAGVVSGAGDYKPGIVLDKQRSEINRQPIALLGKVCCKIDAQYGAVEVGDLLTTSPTPGHAMKAADPLRAFGAVIGKALHSLKSGQGFIPILIALQ
jgi:hypothetical protein